MGKLITSPASGGLDQRKLTFSLPNLPAEEKSIEKKPEQTRTCRTIQIGGESSLEADAGQFARVEGTPESAFAG